MEHNFARLLRSSKFATHDPQLKQVWTTYGAQRETGDWGLKRTMPKVINFKFVTLRDMDNKWRYTHWENGAQQVYGVEKFMEMFGGTKPPVVLEEGVKRSEVPVEINRLTEKEWTLFLEKMETKREEWMELKKNQARSGVEECLVFANAVAPQVAAGGGAFGSAKVPSKISDLRKPVGITYSHQAAKPIRTVQGRILNRAGSEHVVGVAGMVAKLQGSVSLSYADASAVSRSLQEFYVISADINPKGQPEILLSKHRPLTSTFMKHQHWRGAGPTEGRIGVPTKKFRTK